MSSRELAILLDVLMGEPLNNTEFQPDPYLVWIAIALSQDNVKLGILRSTKEL